MKQKILLACLILNTISFGSTNAQTIIQPVKAVIRTADSVNVDQSLNGQYQFMLSKSKSVNGYKLVNPLRLSGFWKSINDTLNKNKIELIKTKEKTLEQEKTINYLKTEISGKESSLNEVSIKENEIALLGFSLTKSTYHITIWSIIFILSLSLIVVILRSSKNIKEAQYRTQLYDEIANEFQTFKIKASEKERKLARELQDERNLLDEIKKRN